MRADARATTLLIREAAIKTFVEQGLDAPLEGIARAAGVSKGTIYNRFGSRDGLIEAVVDDLAATEVTAIFEQAHRHTDALARLEASLLATWRTQFTSPVMNDVLTATHPASPALGALCRRASETSGELLAAAQASGQVRADLTPEDLYGLVLMVGAAAREGSAYILESRERLMRHLLLGLRP